VRFWSRDGSEDATLDMLRAGRLDDIDAVEPSPVEFEAHLDRDLTRSRRHLRQVVEGYNEREWRREHRQPDDDLWRAAAAVCALEDARGATSPS
jgi:hypothetical protein